VAGREKEKERRVYPLPAPPVHSSSHYPKMKNPELKNTPKINLPT
jgi:hypothetical protein